MAAGLSCGAGPGPLSGSGSRSRSVPRCGCHPPSPRTARRHGAPGPSPRRGGVPAPLPEWKATGAGRGGPAGRRPRRGGGRDRWWRPPGGAGPALLAAGPAVPAGSGDWGLAAPPAAPRPRAEVTAGGGRGCRAGRAGAAAAASPGKRGFTGALPRNSAAAPDLSRGSGARLLRPPAAFPGARRLPRGRGPALPRWAGSGFLTGRGAVRTTYE